MSERYKQNAQWREELIEEPGNTAHKALTFALGIKG